MLKLRQSVRVIEHREFFRCSDDYRGTSRIFSPVNYFAGLNFRVGFISVVMTARRNKLTLFIRRRRKYFAGLIFVMEDDCRKFCRNNNFPDYGSQGCTVLPVTPAPLPLVL